MAGTVDIEQHRQRVADAVASEWRRGVTRPERRGASELVDRCLLEAHDAGVSAYELASIVACGPAWVQHRLRRARTAARESLAEGYVTLDEVAARLGISTSRVTRLRTTGQLPMKRVTGWWVAAETDVVRLKGKEPPSRRVPPPSCPPRGGPGRA